MKKMSRKALECAYYSCPLGIHDHFLFRARYCGAKEETHRPTHLFTNNSAYHMTKQWCALHH